MNLFQLSQEYLEAKVTLDDPDLPEDAIQDTLEALEIPWTEKVINTARYIKNLEAEVGAMVDAEREIAARRRALNDKLARIKEYLQREIEKTGLTAKAPDIGTVDVVTNPPYADIFDIAQVPECLFVSRREPNRQEILRRMKLGEDIPGASMARTRRLRIG